MNGLHLKEWVKIRLTFMDEYTISFINRNREVVKVVEGVYCDELISVLDWIENGD